MKIRVFAAAILMLLPGAARAAHVDAVRLGDLGKKPSFFEAITRDGRHCAVTSKVAGDKEVAVIDGKHVAHTAKQGEQWFVIVDGQPVTTDYEVIAEYIRPTFAPDGSLDFLALKGAELFRVTWKP